MIAERYRHHFLNRGIHLPTDMRRETLNCLEDQCGVPSLDHAQLGLAFLAREERQHGNIDLSPIV